MASRRIRVPPDKATTGPLDEDFSPFFQPTQRRLLKIRMADLSRVAQAALRSASLLRTTPLIRSRPCRNLALANTLFDRNHISTTPSFSNSFDWTNPSYGGRRTTENTADVQKPNSSSYNIAFGGKSDNDTKNQEPMDFSSDLHGLDVSDVTSNKQSKPAASAPRPSLRLVPRTGRTVYVKKDVDVARSFKLLAIQVGQNKIRQDFQLQRFHERPGKKRKRLKSVRWQSRFKKGFKATISRVRELTAQGWHTRYETGSDTDISTPRTQRRTFRGNEKAGKEAERESKISKLQGQLQDVQDKVRDLAARHNEQMGQSNELLGKLDATAQQVGNSIRSYLEKHDHKFIGTVSECLDMLQRQLENNIERWNREMMRKREFEGELLKDYRNSMTWYQREIETLQRHNSDKEALLEQLRADFPNERQRLNDEYMKQINAKATEYTRLTEKQYRKQERLATWHSKKINEIEDKWQERLASVQEKNTHLVRTRIEQQVEHQMEARKADEKIRNLTRDLNNVKQDLDAMSKVNQDLEILLNESKQITPDESQALREELDELSTKNKDYLGEIEQFCRTTKDLEDKVRNYEENIKRCERELIGCKEKLGEAPREIQELQESHRTVIEQLKEDFTREKALSEKAHQQQIRAEQDKWARLEQVVESLRDSNHEQNEQHRKALEENTRTWQDDIAKRRIEWQNELNRSYELVREAKAEVHARDAKIETLRQEAQGSLSRAQNLASEMNQTKEAQQSTLKVQEELTLAKQAAEKDLSNLRRALEGAENEKKSLSKQVTQLETNIQNTTEENKSLAINLKATAEKLTAKVKEVSAALQDSEEKKQQLVSLQSLVEQNQKQLLDSQSQIKQKDSELEQLRVNLKDEQNRREECDTEHKVDLDGNERRIAELTAQLDASVKQMKDVELSYNIRIIEQNKLLKQRNKTIKSLEASLGDERRDNQELQETMKKALVKEETKRSLIFNEFQKLRKEIRVMCRIRPTTPRDGAILEYATSEGKFHSKPAGIEIITQKSLYGTTTQVKDRSKHYHFDRVFEAQETNEDVWLEISQFVQSFIEGRQVTIFCYGQTATGKTYTMSNSEHAVDANGDPILTNEGIMPRSKDLIFEEANRRREKGWSIAVRGCCYEVYVKEIRQLLSNNQIKTKSLDPTGPPWWHVRDPEYQSLDSVEDFDAMFESAMESRTFAETTSNSNSSRSHFILYLEFEAKSPTMKKANKGILCLVDLAGSEDPHKASALDDQSIPGGGGASENTERKKIREQRLREGIAINQSLRVLRKSISKIRNPTAATGKPTLEGGDEESSTLAKLLGPCLGRESMVLMFVMINLGADSLAETKATLESGKEIAEIKLSPKRTAPPRNTEEQPSTDDKRAEAAKDPTTPRKPGFNRGSKIPKFQG
ncbi:hypothetical protein GQX73_g106 [Xylaria multiplex]|uniref:Kinesin motor domain-containing protein n=1 Tax=Xylaria multiplex TaxID=323545 RepID=A0A7C8J8K8_9PEZI|nr:hypothetical protein GQX73_g106 [Xylaria multiplex]